MGISAEGGVDLAAAARRLSGRVHRTPLLHSRMLAERAGQDLWLKAESLQRGGSFKARGAFNAVLAGLEEGDRRGLLAVSSGNHGGAVALAAHELGLAATVVMPEGSSEVKRRAVLAYGAEVVSQGVTGANREQLALSLAEERHLRLVHPHDDPLVIAGQATVGQEIAEQAEELGLGLARVVVPVGGGGLLAGVCLALERQTPGVEVVGVEPVAGDDGARSLRGGQLVTLDSVPDTCADGARTLHLGRLDWELLRGRASRIVTVSEADIALACWWLWTRCKLVVEPTGAMPVAALLSGALEAGAGVTACVLSGGNCTPLQLAELLQGLPPDDDPG